MWRRTSTIDSSIDRTGVAVNIEERQVVVITEMKVGGGCGVCSLGLSEQAELIVAADYERQWRAANK